MRFEFEESPSPKGTCPKCGHNKKFRYYKGLSHEYGRCERANNCGFHNDPHGKIQEAPVIVPKPDKKTAYPDPKDILRIKNDITSPFHLYCEINLGFNRNEWESLGVGTKDSLTAFIYKSKEGKDVNVKFIEYNEIKRNKSKNPFSLKPKEGEQFQSCLFLEHLLSDSKTICLVESEKTAIIARKSYPQFDWLATGGRNGLTDKNIHILFNRKVFYIQDADKGGRDNSTIKKLQGYKIEHEVIDLFPGRTDSYDLADAILDGKQPTIEPQKEAIPDINLGFKMNANYQIKHSEPSITWQGKKIISIGEIFALVALPGTGKSQLIEILGSQFIASKNDFEIDSLGFGIEAKRECLIIDTERSLDDNRNGFNRILRRTEAERRNLVHPDSGEIIDLDYRCFIEIDSLENRKRAFEYLVKTGKYSLVIVDGILDFSKGLNNEEDAGELIRWFRALANRYEFALAVTIHPNKGTSTIAGHLGAFLYRYARACLLVRPTEEDKDIKEITVNFEQGKLSHAGQEIGEVFFSWDEDQKLMVSVDKPEAEYSYNYQTLKVLFNAAKLNGMFEIPANELKKSYATELGIKPDTAKKHISQAVTDNRLIRIGGTKSTKYKMPGSFG